MAEEGISRRDFLKAAAGATAAVAAGVASKELREQNDSAEIPPIPERPEVNIANLTEEERQMVNEIAEFRGVLNLHSPAAELARLEQAKPEWENLPEPIETNLQQELQPYGMIITDVMDKVFKDSSGRLVRKIENHSIPHTIGFSPTRRSVLLGQLVTTRPLDDFVGTALHEGAGHGSDPGLENIEYPRKMLLEVTHGKWKALSRSLKIEGQFLNHPGDLVFPLIKREFGAMIGRSVIEGGLSANFSENGHNLAGEILSRIAAERNVTADELFFNKEVSMELGERLISASFEGNLIFRAPAQHYYEQLMENKLSEIYAEMVRIAIHRPELLGDDEAVKAGISQVISSVRGQEVDLETIGNEINDIPKQIVESRRPQREPGSPALENMQVQAPQTNQELPLAEGSKDKFEEFLNGRIPEFQYENISDETLSVMRSYAQAVSAVATHYPSIGFSVGEYDMRFDPQLHLWEIKNIEHALDHGFIRNLLNRSDIDPQVHQDIRDRTEVLFNFINSGSFGT